MNYEQKYKEALERAKKFYNNEGCRVGMTPVDLEVIFPELKESEGEKIRKQIISFLKEFEYDHYRCLDFSSWIAWLEKQGNEPNWCHHKVDLSNCSEEYRKAYYDGWNNCNMQHSQCKSESNDVVKCLINGMKFYYEDNTEATWGTEKFSMKVKDILSWLEKQGEQKPVDKVEPKFKIGDFIANDYCRGKVVELTNDAYLLDTGQGIPFSCEHNVHLWTIKDAKDGDVLFLDLMGGKTFIYNGINPNTAILYSFIISNDGEDVLPYHIGKPNVGIGNIEETKNIIRPATKEQRDLLFQKMKEDGYGWNANTKELIKL